MFTAKFFWFVLRNAKTFLTSSELRHLFNAWCEVKSNFLGTKSPRSIQRLWSTTQAKPYNLTVSLLLSNLQKKTLNLIFYLLNVPSVISPAISINKILFIIWQYSVFIGFQHKCSQQEGFATQNKGRFLTSYTLELHWESSLLQKFFSKDQWIATD